MEAGDRFRQDQENLTLAGVGSAVGTVGGIGFEGQAALYRIMRELAA
jgi:hypothetical protein